MKKIYSFIAMMLMCFATTANAQHQWAPVGGEETNVSEIIAGTDHFYVLKGGANTNAEGGDGKDIAGTRTYLAAGDKPEQITHECVFNIIETGETQGEHKLYMLRNVSNEKFLAGNGSYESSKAKALKFSIEKGVFVEEGSFTKESTFEDYYNAMSVTRSQGADVLGAWVMCIPGDGMQYLCFYGNPAIAEYIDTNNWLIIPVEEESMSEQDKLLATYNKYFADYSSVEDIDIAFPTGTNPGCVTEEFLAHFKDVYTTAAGLLGQENADDEACKAANAAIVKLFEEEMAQSVIPVSAGYFVLKNVGGRGFLTVTGDGKKGRGNTALKGMGTEEGTDYDTWTPESMVSWNMNSAKYIWAVEESKEEPGKMLFKNFGTEKYLTHNDDYAMADEADANGTLFSVSNFKGLDFLITFGSNGMVHVANHSDNKLLNYNDPNDAASRWKFYTISSVVTDSLTALVQQSGLNDELKELADRAKNDYYSLQYDNYVEGDAYNAPADSGLVSKVFKANSWATQEGSLEALFDGDMKTYFHTAWNEGDVTTQETQGTHWIKLDLGKEVKELTVKFTKRQGAVNGHVSKYAIHALPDADPDSPELGEQVAVSEDSIAFEYGKNNTHIAKYTLDKPVRYICFEVLSTRGRDAGAFDKMTAETGPFWHMSELRFYDRTDIKANAGFDAIPEDVKTTLTAAIEKANAELKDKKATQATIDELNKALEAFWDAYPDATNLKKALEETAKMIEGADEGEDMGYFEEGAKAALSEVVTKLQAAVSEKEAAGVAFTIEEITSYEKELNEAVAAFNAKLHKPVAGRIYQIVCVNGFNADGSDKKQNDNMVISTDADYENGSPSHGYKYTDDDGSHFNSYWLVEETANGLAFKNLANGLYMNNPYDGLSEEEIKDLELPNNHIGYSKTPKSFQLESFTAEGELAHQGYFLMSLKNDAFVNFESTGNLVRWWDRNDANSALTFIDAEEDGATFEGSYQLPVSAGKAKIISLPIAVQGVHVGDDDIIYEVLGMKEGKLQLKQSESTEVKAGHPFIVCPGEGVEAVSVDVNPSLYENVAVDHIYDTVVKGGLVSAPIGFTTEKNQGYGVLINNIVVASEGGDKVAAGTGFFNKSIPTTEEDGDVVLEVEGVISGEGTAVENVEIVKNVASDVYTVSGVKVRHNVKAGVATQGLPKGIYIVGGKKVVVK